MALVSAYTSTANAFLNLSFLVLLSLFLATHFSSSSPTVLRLAASNATSQEDCQGLQKLQSYQARCLYLDTHGPCVSQGYIDYLKIFYCNCGKYPLVGYTLLSLWLLVLFYLSGSTASQYFCSSLEGLSRVLRLPPNIAGVTLLSLGNGAPDVFATCVSFTGTGVIDVGLGSLLGGAFFVTSVVVGVISLSVDRRRRADYIDPSSFIRDGFFLLAALSSVLVILISGSLGLWGSIWLLSLYAVYVIVVSTSHCCWENDGELDAPLLDGIEVEEPIDDVRQESYSNSSWLINLIYLLDMPLYLPRRLTIPDVSEERWSKLFAVASVILSPVLLATLWNSETGELGSEEGLTIYMFGGLVGIVLGIIALETTEKSNPPRKCLLPWLAGGFLMSVVWSYVVAGELVALLVSLGYVLGISPSVLGLTVLSWGNSLGDLITNVAMTMNGGRHGAQIAVSGCYAGPIFNILVGLGLSFVISRWAAGPSSFVIPQDTSLFETVGFLIGGMLWALVVLTRRRMTLDKVLGVGLLAIYFCFMCLRLLESSGLVNFGILEA